LEHGQARHGTDEHVPEAQGRPEVEREQDGADQQQREADDEREPRGRLVRRTAPQPQHGTDYKGAAGDAREEEVQKDVPLPVWRDDEMLVGHYPLPDPPPEGEGDDADPPVEDADGAVSPRRRKAISPARAANTAVIAAGR